MTQAEPLAELPQNEPEAAHMLTEETDARLKRDKPINVVAFSPDGKWVVSGSVDHTVRVWETATGQEVSRMIHDDLVFAVTFSPDGKWVVSGSWDKTVRV